MKFERLFDRANLLGCDKIATGHYARVMYNEKTGLWELRKSLNEKKDQTYVLYFLNQETLPRVLFPLGEFHDKAQVRELAKKHGFVTANKQDSQDICFVPRGDYKSVIEFRSPWVSFTTRHRLGNWLKSTALLLPTSRIVRIYALCQGVTTSRL